jgi:large subunit ribosomal protein L53
MKITHFTSLTASFNPFARHAKTPRLFLSLLPPSARSTVKVTVKQLPRSSTDPSTLEIGFKDGKVLKYTFQDPAVGQKEDGIKLKDVVEQVERHSRGLKRKEDLAG